MAKIYNENSLIQAPHSMASLEIGSIIIIKWISIVQTYKLIAQWVLFSLSLVTTQDWISPGYYLRNSNMNTSQPG